MEDRVVARMSRILAYVGHPTVVGCLITLVGTVLVVLLMNPHPIKSDDTVEIFPYGHPLPAPHNIICPGDRLSLVKAIYTSTKGQISYINGERCYKIDLREKRFIYILFCFRDTKTDPIITRIVFVFRDKEAAVNVKKLALSTFGSKNLKISPPLETLTWRNISGFKITVEQNRTYVVEKAVSQSRSRKANKLIGN